MPLEEIDTHRKHWEADKHWEMRKNFMVMFHETYPRDELLCKAQLYVNIKLLKNEYNQELMNEIKAMSIQVNTSSRKICMPSGF
ncbi:hypothetical protein TYRP_001365 [Tyrophagus putrescentiae]|nr:hypothetical protein TYRP_001365 [Tyrophagus putrescentiae]